MVHLPIDPDRGFDFFTVHVIHELVQKLIDDGFYGESDRDNLTQHFAMQVLVLIPKYDSARGKRTTYIRKTLQNEMVTLIRHHAARCRNTGVATRSLNAPIRTEEGDLSDGSQTVADDAHDARTGQKPRSQTEAADLRLDLAEALKRLPPKQRRVAELHMQSVQVKDIAEQLRVSKVTVGNRNKAILKVFQDLGLDRYLTKKKRSRRDGAT